MEAKKRCGRCSTGRAVHVATYREGGKVDAPVTLVTRVCDDCAPGEKARGAVSVVEQLLLRAEALGAAEVGR